MRKIIQSGETLRLYIDYADIETGAPLDPSALACNVRLPTGVVNTITYPDVNFVKLIVGSYFIRIPGTPLGTHAYRIEAQITASDIDVRDGKFDVEASP